MIDTSSWVEYKPLTEERFNKNVKSRLFAASIEEERPYWLYVATKGIGPRALLTTVSLEFLADQSDVKPIGSVAINLCLKNTRKETIFKSKSFLEKSGFWVPERDVELTITSPRLALSLVRGYFTDVEQTDSDMRQLDAELGTYMETIQPYELLTSSH